MTKIPERASPALVMAPLMRNLPPWQAGITTYMQTPAPAPNQPLDPAAQWVPCYGIQMNGNRPYDAASNPML